MSHGLVTAVTLVVLGTMVLGTGCGQTVLFPIDEAPTTGDEADAAPPGTGLGTTTSPATPTCGAGRELCADGQVCKTGADCTSLVCKDGKCAAPTSSDGVKNAAETDVDCGGPTAPPCVFGKLCQGEKDCAKDLLCKGGKCELGPCANKVKDGAESDVDCGGACATKCDAGNACNVNEDCASKVCTNGKCAPPTYTDKVRNGTETDVDCGGAPSAPKCKDTKGCGGASDCESGVCDPATKTCAVPSCTDTVLNGLETDLDCGGVCKTKCETGKKCKDGGDCVSQVCTAGVLTCAAPSYTDGKKNGTETDVDCGGAPNAPKCKDTKSCVAATDCESVICAGPAGGKTCVAPGCGDVVKNGVETDVDCGGSNACLRCATNQSCLVGSDCKDKICGANAKCSAPTCSDTVQNGTETDADCGGTCATKCDDAKKCVDDADCKSTFCKSNVCQAPSCADQRKNADETDVDCGGAACRGTKKCADTKACKIDADCASGVCDAGVCQAPTCTDRATNGTESDLNCGGTCAKKCSDGQKCNGNPDCASSVCKAGICQAPRCDDFTKNGDETDQDCGGSCATKCDDGKVCKVGGDCKNLVCSGGNAPVCLAPTCMDAAKNGKETDLNCGGPDCAPCNDDLVCKIDMDCKSSLCGAGGTCTPPSCPDNRLNQDETDTDCGGAKCATRCIAGKKCVVNGDCASNTCIGAVGAKTCCQPSWTTTSSTACTAACAGGTQTLNQSDGCGNTRQLTNQACNTQSCCNPNNWTVVSQVCSKNCGGGQYTVTERNDCGSTRQVQGGACNTQDCCTTNLGACCAWGCATVSTLNGGFICATLTDGACWVRWIDRPAPYTSFCDNLDPNSGACLIGRSCPVTCINP